MVEPAFKEARNSSDDDSSMNDDDPPVGYPDTPPDKPG
jgi:hypothetical protein